MTTTTLTRPATLTLTIERGSGCLRFTMPDFPDWAAAAENPHEIARALDAAWVEVEIAAYARSRGTVRDVTAFDDRVDHTRARANKLHRVVSEPTPTPRPQLLSAIERQEDEAARARAVTTAGQVELRRARMWSINYNGTWTSPEGRVFKSSSEHVRRIRAILLEHGEQPRPTGTPAPEDTTVTTPGGRRRHLRAVPMGEQPQLPLPELPEAVEA